MKKIMYTRVEDGGLSIVIPAEKSDIEKVLGPLTQEQYEQHVWQRSVPDTAVKPRHIDEGGIPATRDFRNAWCDVTDPATVDICHIKAKEVQLAKMRAERNAKLDLADKEFMAKFEKGEDTTEIKKKKQDLRDATNPLKALSVSGYNDPLVLEQIKTLGTLAE